MSRRHGADGWMPGSTQEVVAAMPLAAGHRFIQANARLPFLIYLFALTFIYIGDDTIGRSLRCFAALPAPMLMQASSNHLA